MNIILKYLYIFLSSVRMFWNSHILLQDDYVWMYYESMMCT